MNKVKFFMIFLFLCIAAFSSQRYEYSDRVKIPYVECDGIGKVKCLNDYEKIESLLFSLGCFGTDDDIDPDGFVIQKFGRADSLPSGVWATVWDYASTNNIYPKLDTEETMYVSSDESSDSSEIIIYYLDGDYNRKNKTVTLDGTNDVEVASDIMRPYRMRVVSENSVVGNIDLFDTDEVIYARIVDSGDEFNQTQMAVYTIPAGYTGIIKSINAGVGSGKEVQLHYKAQPFGQSNQTKIPLVLYQSNYYEEFSMPHVFPEKTYIEVRAKATGTGVTATARFYLFLIKTSILQNICDKITF